MTNNSAIAYLNLPVSTRDHIRGASNALVTLVEYGDYECPHCGCAHLIVKQIQRWLGADNLCFVFRHFPISQLHPYAEYAAETAEAADAQGKFWEMHDYLFEHQQRLDNRSIVRYANEINLDIPRLMHDLAVGKYQKHVREDFTSGVRSGANGTPTFFINGVRHNGSYDFDTLLAVIDDAGVSLGTSEPSDNH